MPDMMLSRLAVPFKWLSLSRRLISNLDQFVEVVSKAYLTSKQVVLLDLLSNYKLTVKVPWYKGSEYEDEYGFMTWCCEHGYASGEYGHPSYWTREIAKHFLEWSEYDSM